MARSKPTEMQKAAIDRLVELGGKSVSMAMRTSSLPYSPKTAENPQKLTESVGGRAYLDECGLTKRLIASSLAEDIKAKPGNRKPELDLGADILGMKGGEGETKVSPVININFIGLNPRPNKSTEAKGSMGEVVRRED